MSKAKDGKARTYTRQDLIADLEKEFGPDAVRRGRVLFAENCARCHSSIPDTPADSFKTRDFHAVAEDHPRKIRKDFLGNEFVLWLWSAVENNHGLVTVAAETGTADVGVVIDKALDLDCAWAARGRMSRPTGS